MTVVEQRERSGDVHWTGAPADSPWIAKAEEVAAAASESAAAFDESGDFVHPNFDLLRDAGLLSMLVPADVGGGGATHAEACAVLATLARGCPATSLALSMHTHLIAAQVWRHHRDLPAPVLAKVADQQLVLVSTGASDWLESNGSAEKTDAGFRVSGRKAPASGAPAGDILVTSIRWEGPDGAQVLHAAVPFSTEGVSIVETWDTLGMRATGSHTVVLDDVVIPEAAVSLIRPADEWHPVWSTVVGAAMPLIMSSYVGVAEAAAERAVALAGRRAGRPDVAAVVGRMLGRLTAAKDSVRAIIDSSQDLRFDNTLEHAAMTLARKSTATAAAIDTVSLALDAGGGAAFARGSGIDRLFRDVQGARYHPLSTDRQERFTGRVALGLDPAD
jgi:alkylation response protein AidB-like acyl-CoA dehydrogenase